MLRHTCPHKHWKSIAFMWCSYRNFGEIKHIYRNLTMELLYFMFLFLSERSCMGGGSHHATRTCQDYLIKCNSTKYHAVCWMGRVCIKYSIRWNTFSQNNKTLPICFCMHSTGWPSVIRTSSSMLEVCKYRWMRIEAYYAIFVAS